MLCPLPDCIDDPHDKALSIILHSIHNKCTSLRKFRCTLSNQETENWLDYTNQKTRAFPFGFSHEEYCKKEPGRAKQRENSVPLTEAEEYDQLKRLCMHAQLCTFDRKVKSRCSKSRTRT